MNERSTRGPGRRVGRDAVLEAAVSLVAEADLTDLLSFLGTRAVAEAADVQPATVHHHFGNRDAKARHNARLAAAVIDACLHTAEGDGTTEALESIVTDDTVDLSALDAVRAAARTNLEGLLADRRFLTAVHVAAAVADNDPSAREALRRSYDGALEAFAASAATLTAQLNRRFDVEHGFTAESTALLGMALVDGLALRHCFDPDRVDADLFAEVCLRLFEIATTAGDDPDEMLDDPVVERLLRRSSSLDLPADSHLDQTKRNGIVDAVRELFEEGGVPAITVSGVARRAGVSRGTVIANFGGRSGLAAAVWAQYVPDLERRLESDRSRNMTLGRVTERHLHRVVDLCKAMPELTALLLDGMIGETTRRGAPTYQEPDDPRAAVPIAALLAPVLHDARDDLRPGLADTPEQAKDLAATFTYLTMVRATSRPAETTSQTVHHVMDLVMDGIVARD